MVKRVVVILSFLLDAHHFKWLKFSFFLQHVLLDGEEGLCEECLLLIGILRHHYVGPTPNFFILLFLSSELRRKYNAILWPYLTDLLELHACDLTRLCHCPALFQVLS